MPEYVGERNIENGHKVLNEFSHCEFLLSCKSSVREWTDDFNPDTVLVHVFEFPP